MPFQRGFLDKSKAARSGAVEQSKETIAKQKEQAAAKPLSPIIGAVHERQPQPTPKKPEPRDSQGTAGSDQEQKRISKFKQQRRASAMN